MLPLITILTVWCLICLVKPLRVSKPIDFLIFLPSLLVLTVVGILWYTLQLAANLFRALARSVWGVDFQGG